MSVSFENVGPGPGWRRRREADGGGKRGMLVAMGLPLISERDSGKAEDRARRERRIAGTENFILRIGLRLRRR